MSKKRSVSVGRRALFQRLNRSLTKDGERLLTTRADSPWLEDNGRYYTVDARNHVSRTHVDLSALAKERGVLSPWEKLDDAE